MTVTAVLEYGLERALVELEAEVDAAGIAPPPLPEARTLPLPGLEDEQPALPATSTIKRRGEEPRRQAG